jgi:ATP-binding cassette, subfamily B, bacterial CvaB/MchF/RaxB
VSSLIDKVIDFKMIAAIVGLSGGGKTTLLNVMLGIHPPTEGEVLVGGMRLKDLGLDAMRQMIGTVLQDDVLFAGSIADNISFFDPAADPAWIEECANLAAIHADIAAMPMGYNTLVGDMGTVLSGGQKQRVLLARALYKRPKILFLDEATSHLDLEREQAVNASIKALNMTRIIVAHRPETIASADRVISLREGKIIEQSPPPAMQSRAHRHRPSPATHTRSPATSTATHTPTPGPRVSADRASRHRRARDATADALQTAAPGVPAH